MSVFCICASSPLSVRMHEIRAKLTNKAYLLGIGIQFTGYYIEPFLDQFDRTMLVNIADDFNFENCEHLLCRDGCSIDGEYQVESLFCRMHKVQSLLSEFCGYVRVLHLFIGESGIGFESFKHMQCRIQDFPSQIVSAYNQVDDVPNLHVTIYL